MASHANTPSFFKPRLLVCALQAALPLLAGAAYAQSADPATATQLEAITVTSSADASAEGLSKPYAGGQVARGGRAGILGTQDNMDTPFSITSYTNEFIKNQQARSVADVLQNDPTVRVARGFGNFQEAYFIRGFILSSDDIAYNGLYGLLPRQYSSAELIERVEVLRGASAFLTGATPSGGGIGGNINLVPKRAPNQALNEVSVGYSSDSQAYIGADFARRFGPDQSTGIRINAAHRNGETGVKGEDVKLDVFSVGVDWRSRNVRLSADLGYQNHRLSNPRPNVTITDSSGAPLVAFVPRAPQSDVNYAQSWTFSNEKDIFGTVRAEYDINDNVTAWAAVGARNGKESNRLAGMTVRNATTGNGDFSRFDNNREDDVKSAEVGMRGKLTTGGVKHNVTAAFSFYSKEEKAAYRWDFFNTFANNLYNPYQTAMPAFTAGAFAGNDMNNPAVLEKTRLSSFAIGDTMSFIDGRVLLTVGARQQKLNNTSYAYNTGIADPNSASKVSPVAGLVFKLSNQVSLYGNYIEGLAKGTKVADATLANNGQFLGAYVSKQKELGVKYDGGKIGGGIALFSTKKPGNVVENNRLTINGEDQHNGVEITAYGEPMKGVRVLGGFTYLDAEQKRAQNSANSGKRVIGVPKTQGSLGAEWDVAQLQGFSVNGRIVATGNSYADGGNALRVPGWSRLDIGARYLTEIGGKLVTLRARIDNVTDKNYWASSGGYPNNGYLVLGAPRTFALTASVDF
ncbi:Ferrichrome receptor FcuA precursor [compost metagenome]